MPLKGAFLSGRDRRTDQPPKQARIFDNIKILLAGEAAQAQFNKRTVRHWQGGSDFQKAIDLALRLSGSGKGASLLLAWLRYGTVQSVEVWWPEIEVVAAALLKRKTLTGDEVRQVINEYYDARIASRKGSKCPA